MNVTFSERFQKLSQKRRTLLCIGLDPDPERIPAEYLRDGNAGILAFLLDVVVATQGLAAAFKPNLAFFEALGRDGWSLFADLVQKIREQDPTALIIADAKRGDIGNSAAAYARAFFEELDCDALTVNPYMGDDTLKPYLAHTNRAVIILCLTSNPGASVFQLAGDPPLYLRVARESALLQKEFGNVWMVVGATRTPEQMKRIRETAPDVPWLVPGIGAQGGNLASVVSITGGQALINASRSILYATEERAAVPEAARTAAEELVKEMRKFL